MHRDRRAGGGSLRIRNRSAPPRVAVDMKLTLILAASLSLVGHAQADECSIDGRLAPEGAGGSSVLVAVSPISFPTAVHGGQLVETWSVAPDGLVVAGETRQAGGDSLVLLHRIDSDGPWAVCAACRSDQGDREERCGPTFEVQLAKDVVVGPKRHPRRGFACGRRPRPHASTVELGTADTPVAAIEACFLDSAGAPLEGPFRLEVVGEDGRAQSVQVDGPNVRLSIPSGYPESIQAELVTGSGELVSEAVRNSSWRKVAFRFTPRGGEDRVSVGFRQRKVGRVGLITSVEVGGPADRAGIAPGDRLVEWSELGLKRGLQSARNAIEAPRAARPAIRVRDPDGNTHRVELDLSGPSGTGRWTLGEEREPEGELGVPVEWSLRGRVRGGLLERELRRSVWVDLLGPDGRTVRAQVGPTGRFAARGFGDWPLSVRAGRRDGPVEVDGPLVERPAAGWPAEVVTSLPRHRSLRPRLHLAWAGDEGAWVTGLFLEDRDAGLRVGDRIVAVDGHPMDGPARLDGPEGTPAVLRVIGLEGGTRRVELPRSPAPRGGWVSQAPAFKRLVPGGSSPENPLEDAVVVWGQVDNARLWPGQKAALEVRACEDCWQDRDPPRRIRLGAEGRFVVLLPADGPTHTLRVVRNDPGGRLTSPVVRLEGPLRSQRLSLQMPDELLASPLGIAALRASYRGSGVLLAAGPRLIDRVFVGPMQESCVHHEDLLLGIDGAPVDGMDIDEVRTALLGPAGTSVRLTLRRGDGPTFDCEERRVLPLAPDIWAAP